MTLPASFTPVALRGLAALPQTAAATVSGLAVRVTVTATTTDLPALIDAEPTRLLVDGASRSQGSRQSVPADVRAWLRQPPGGSLAEANVAVSIIVHAGDRLLGTVPALVGTPWQLGSSEGGLQVEVLVTELVLVAGSLVRPSDLGSRIELGVRRLDLAVDRYRPVAPPRPIAAKAPPVASQRPSPGPDRTKHKRHLEYLDELEVLTELVVYDGPADLVAGVDPIDVLDDLRWVEEVFDGLLP